MMSDPGVPGSSPRAIRSIFARATSNANSGSEKSTASKPPKPFSLRLTFEERAQLEAAAGDLPLGAYIRWRLLDPENNPPVVPPRRRNKNPVKDHQALIQVLGKLGQTRIANNLNQLTRLANMGSLEVSPDVEAELIEAARHIAEMRHDLIVALGLDDGPP